MSVWQEIWHAVLAEFSDIPDVDQATRITLRLLIASILGGLIGYERELSGKAAGLRTAAVLFGFSAAEVLRAEIERAARSGIEVTPISVEDPRCTDPLVDHSRLIDLGSDWNVALQRVSDRLHLDAETVSTREPARRAHHDTPTRPRAAAPRPRRHPRPFRKCPSVRVATIVCRWSTPD